MRSAQKISPSFFILGAQKAGTTWLWNMLGQHPGTSLPQTKEIHYFGSAELHAKGQDWYYGHFAGLDREKVIGEASTSHFFDRVPYFYNDSSQIEFDPSLPPIPELMNAQFPEAKFIVILRDPVHRAVSAYSHWMKQGKLSPMLGLKRVAIEHPKLRILEYGFYGRYLEAWMGQIPAERFRIILYEQQIKRNWEQTLRDTYLYLGLDPDFTPERAGKAAHKRWPWSRILFNYYTGKVFNNIDNSALSNAIGRLDFLPFQAITPGDVEFLRSNYLPEKGRIASLTGLDLSSWDYGEKLLQS